MAVRKQPAPPQRPVFSGKRGDNPIKEYATYTLVNDIDPGLCRQREEYVTYMPGYMPEFMSDMMREWIRDLPITREKARKAAQAPRRKAMERSAKALATYDARLAVGMRRDRARDATVVEHHISPRTLDRYLEKRRLRQQPR